MTFISPFIKLAPELVAQLTNLVEVSYDISFPGASLAMIRLRDTNDCFDQIREATATTSSAIHRVENFCRHDQLPRILIEHLADRILNFSLGDKIAGANEHFFSRPFSGAFQACHCDAVHLPLGAAPENRRLEHPEKGPPEWIRTTAIATVPAWAFSDGMGSRPRHQETH
jgi:hypothetical protein